MTRRVSIEEKLQHQEGPFHLLVEQSNFVGMVVVNDRFKLEYVNNRFCDIFGRTRSELLRNDFREFLHPESITIVEEHYLRRQKGENLPSVYEFKGIHKDGSTKYLKISSSVLRVEDGSMKTVAQLVDITEEKTNQQALKDSEQKHRTLVETIDSGLVIDDENGITVMVNQPLCTMLGYDDSDELVGTPIISWIDGWTENDVAEKVQDRREGKSEHYELNLVHKSGMVVPVLIHASPWYSPTTGEYLGSIAIITDVGDLKQTEAEVRFLLDLLMHDIGNQLQLILAGADLLGSDIPPEQTPNARRYVIDGANRCLELITNIRRAEESKSEPLRPMDAIAILKSQIHLFGKQYGVDPEVSELPKDILVSADSALSHLFWNIMENSIKHNPHPEKKVWIAGRIVNKVLLLRFSDNGPGLPFKKKESLFDPTRRSRGVGIHLVRRLATKYNASISVGDRIPGEPDKGLEISIKFPLIVRKH